MELAATVLRWGFFGVGSALLIAFVVTAARQRRDGASFGELAELMEREWFSAGKVFFTVLVGLVGSWSAAYVGGTRSGLQETVPILFPLGVVAAFVVCSLTKSGSDISNSLRIKALVLLAAPLPIGAVMTGW
ncbi:MULTISPECIES: hypothetical protein [Streptomyces]|uniref:hypothetical protein n=1 Tax=Streptomyces TaxID=1883 RepID=UPI0004C77AD4|nr:hypothetical protein [Streptomyces rimosus]